jgi:hypothetical protein
MHTADLKSRIFHLVREETLKAMEAAKHGAGESPT